MNEPIGRAETFARNGDKIIIREETFVRDCAAAKVLGITSRTLRNWRNAGSGPRFAKIGGAVWYNLRDLEAFMLTGNRRIGRPRTIPRAAAARR